MSTIVTELDQMYRVAEDWEADVLDALRRRAGITWECEGCWTNTADTATCDQCGAAYDKHVEGN